jgi:hypothetical protein
VPPARAEADNPRRAATAAPTPVESPPAGAAETAPVASASDADTTRAPEETLHGPEESLPLPEATTGYDHLFEATIMKSVEAAAVRPEVEEEAEGEASVDPAALGDVGDHDGLTMMSGNIAELRKRAATSGTVQDAGASTPAPEPGEPQFRIDFSDGRSELLDRPVIVGRSPSANRVSGSELPRLVTVGGSDPDISRSHVRFTVEGGTVVITDLHSRNGTLMSLPGRPPQKLREGEPTSALAGTVVDLGGGIRITVAESTAER